MCFILAAKIKRLIKKRWKKSRSAQFGRCHGGQIPANFTTELPTPNGHGAVRYRLPKAGLHERSKPMGGQQQRSPLLYFRNPIPNNHPFGMVLKPLVKNRDSLLTRTGWMPDFWTITTVSWTCGDWRKHESLSIANGKCLHFRNTVQKTLITFCQTDWYRL